MSVDLLCDREAGRVLHSRVLPGSGGSALHTSRCRGVGWASRCRWEKDHLELRSG